jgi:hypothetical protein
MNPRHLMTSAAIVFAVGGLACSFAALLAAAFALAFGRVLFGPAPPPD